MSWVGPDRLPVEISLRKERIGWVLQMNRPLGWGDLRFSPLYLLHKSLDNGIEIWTARDGHGWLATEETEDGEFYVLGYQSVPVTGVRGPAAVWPAIIEGEYVGEISITEFVRRMGQIQGFVVGEPIPQEKWSTGEFADVKPPADSKPNTSTLLPLDQYDLVMLSFSGGKDSVACVLHLLDLGVPKSKMEIWHQGIDGDPDNEPSFMDWPCTPSYCRAFAQAMEIPILFQWREGGFFREMNLNNEFGGEVVFDDGSGRMVTTKRSPRARRRVRRKFPAPTSNLQVRWCSSALKIEVAARSITNSTRLNGPINILYITGERRQESAARGKYAEIEKHRTSTIKRRVDHWRPIINWHEGRVWDAFRRYGINPHPCYHLGWGRCSCMACVFGQPNQWASVREISPKLFDQIAELERDYGYTINMKGKSVDEVADAGTPLCTIDEARRAQALSESYTLPIMVDPATWDYPRGAFRVGGGPT